MTFPSPSKVISFLSSSKGDDSHLIVKYYVEETTNTLSSAVRASSKLATIVLISDSTKPILHIIIHNEVSEESVKKTEDFCILINQNFAPSVMKVEPQFHETSPVKTTQITSFNLEELRKLFEYKTTATTIEEIITAADDNSLFHRKPNHPNKRK